MVNFRVNDLPGWARVGQQCLHRRAIVSPGNMVTFTVEIAQQWLEENGL